MEKQIFQDVADPARRLQLIEDNCDTIIENHEYQRQFEPEEVDILEHELSEALVQIQVMEERLATIKAEYKAEMDPLKEKIKTNVRFVREGVEKVTGTCYAFKDMETREIGLYSREGYLISVPRRLKPDEGVQKTIKLREGNNG